MPFDLREHLDPGATVSLERSEEEGLGEPWQEKRGHQTIQSLARDKAAWTPPPRLRVGVAEPFWACRLSCCVHAPGGEESSQLDVPSCTGQTGMLVWHV